MKYESNDGRYFSRTLIKVKNAARARVLSMQYLAD